MLVSVKECGRGVNKDLAPSELAPGQWSDALNVRFRNRFAKKRGGIAAAYTTPAVIPYFLSTYLTTTSRFLVEAGIAKVYVDDGATQSQITRYTDGAAIASITSAAATISTITNSTTTATLTATGAHGRTTGDTMVVSGATPAAYNGTFVITVTGANTFTYTMLSDPGGSASVVGTLSPSATLTTSTAHGLSTGNTATVFGAVPAAYNGTFPITVTGATAFTYALRSDPAGSATTVGQYSYDVQADFTGAIDNKWTGGAFNGVLVLNNPVDGMYYWNGDTNTRLRRMPGWPAGQKCDAILFFKNYIIALAPTISGAKQPQLILWGSAAEAGSVPASWTATATNDAGDTPQTAETGGALVDGAVFGDVAYIYDQDSVFGLRYIGGNDVFQVFRTPDSTGLLSAGCIANTPKGQVFLSNGDIRIHSGGDSVSIAEGVMRDDFRADLDSTNAARAFLVVNAPFNEVWVCYPSYGQAACDKIWAWNWDQNTWAPYALSMTCATSGLIATGLSANTWASDSETWISDPTTWTQNEYSQNEQRLIIGNATPKIGLADTGTTDFGTSVSWRLEKRGIQLDDPDSVKVLSGSRWHFEGLAGTTASIYHGTHQTAGAEPSYTSAATHTQGATNFVNRFSKGGRYMAIKAEGTADQPLTLRSYDIDFVKQGRF